MDKIGRNGVKAHFTKERFYVEIEVGFIVVDGGRRKRILHLPPLQIFTGFEVPPTVSEFGKTHRFFLRYQFSFSEESGPLFQARTDGVAVRIALDSLKNASSLDDFWIYCVGTWDPIALTLVAHPAPIRVLMQSAKVEVENG